MKSIQNPALTMGLLACIAGAALMLRLLAHWSATEQDPIMRPIEPLALLICIALPVIGVGIATVRFFRSCEK